MTEWRYISGFPDYEISEDGIVRRRTECQNAPAGKVLRPKVDRDGILGVSLFRNGKARHFRICSLVAREFIGELPASKGHFDVAYFDGNPQNLHFSNLHWVRRRRRALSYSVATNG